MGNKNVLWSFLSHIFSWFARFRSSALFAFFHVNAFTRISPSNLNISLSIIGLTLKELGSEIPLATQHVHELELFKFYQKKIVGKYFVYNMIIMPATASFRNRKYKIQCQVGKLSQPRKPMRLIRWYSFIYHLISSELPNCSFISICRPQNSQTRIYSINKYIPLRNIVVQYRNILWETDSSLRTELNFRSNRNPIHAVDKTVRDCSAYCPAKYAVRKRSPGAEKIFIGHAKANLASLWIYRTIRFYLHWF